MIPENTDLSIASKLLASDGTLEALPALQLKAEFATISEDNTGRNQVELSDSLINDAITFLAQYSRTDQESDFFRLLAEYLAKALDGDFVCIDSLEGDGLNARTVAVWCDGAFEDNVVYTLKDTPCGVLVGKTVCCFPASVCQFFPLDTVLQDLKAESYVGATLWSHTGKAIGLIAVIKRNTLINQQRAEELLKIVAVRAASEMERIEVEKGILLQNQELKKLNAEKDKFFSIIAHDLRSPLSGFLGLTQIMAEELPSLTLAQVQDIAVTMSKSATNIYRLLENLLQWSRMQQGAIPFNPEKVQLSSMVEESIEMIREAAKNKGIVIANNIPDGLAVLADINLLQTIIRNLLSNAVKFTNKGGTVSLSAKSTDDHSIEIAIRDSGIGMSLEMVENLFRIDVKTNRPGTDGEPSAGLGLLLCKEFIEMHGGNICVESEVGIGSKFNFALPGKDEPKQIPPCKSEILVDVEENKLNQLKILIVDDDDSSARLLTLMVRMFGKEILRACNGFEAVEAYRNNLDIDLILMDISMPMMNGYEATSQIRQFKSDVIIIAQTAFALNGQSETVLQSGFNDHILKPIKKTELIQLVQKYFMK